MGMESQGTKFRALNWKDRFSGGNVSGKKTTKTNPVINVASKRTHDASCDHFSIHFVFGLGTEMQSSNGSK